MIVVTEHNFALAKAYISDNIGPAETIVATAIRSDGYWFFVTIRAGKRYIHAGCHKWYTFRSYRRHVKFYSGRKARSKRKETLAILNALDITSRQHWYRGDKGWTTG